MKTTRRKIWVIAIAPIVALGLAAAMTAVQAQPDGRDDHRITGSWDVTVFFTRPAGLAPVKALYTFTGGGAWVMTAQNDRRMIGPGHGVWTRTEENKFGVTLVRMRFDPATATYIGTLKARGALNLSEDGDVLSGPYDSDFFDKDGNLTGPAFAGTIEARRIKVEPLE